MCIDAAGGFIPTENNRWVLQTAHIPIYYDQTNLFLFF